MDADIPLIGAMYTFLVIIVGQFFMLNLILAVIINTFMKKQEEQLHEILEARAEEEYIEEIEEEEDEDEPSFS